MCASTNQPTPNPHTLPSCYAPEGTKVPAVQEEVSGGALVGNWAYEVLPFEVLERVWNLIPEHIIGTLNKDCYLDWKRCFLTTRHKTHRDLANVAKVLRRQVLMNHCYSFSVSLDIRSASWIKMRPWVHNGSKFASFLHYLKALCQHANRQQMAVLCRDAIDRHEGKKNPEHKQRVRGAIVGKRNDWVSIA